ncbi:hypothetical protein ERHA55_28180 [Erwinia rhapontici]|nr:TonB-dependent receptor [Erwinia rhapontici]BCQ45291.1 hypothetical protein ERHA55_28180 [Erwinia rhapontici]
MLALPGIAAAATDTTIHTAADEMVVTATKTALPAVEVPASLSVLYGEDLEAQRVEEISQLAARTPGLVFQPWGQSGTNLPVMRGLSGSATGFSSSVLLTEDGVPQLTNQGFDNAFMDVERVEILRGPQSSLYGRNAEAGVINVVTRTPDNLQRGRIDAIYGSRNRQQLRGSFSTPLVEDRLYMAVAGSGNPRMATLIMPCAAAKPMTVSVITSGCNCAGRPPMPTISGCVTAIRTITTAVHSGARSPAVTGWSTAAPIPGTIPVPA